MSGPALDRVLQRVTGLKAVSGGWVARCPAHDDQIQSLQISEREDLSVGLHCHAGCEKQSMLAAMNLTFADLYSSKEEEIVDVYDYKSLDGTLLYQSVRFYPKSFKQRRPDATQKSGWVWNMQPFSGKHVPYRLNELKGQNVVVVVEGEKDANRLWKIGIPATTNVGGAKKWSSSDSKWLKAAGVQRIIMIPDNDAPGYAHVELVAQSVKQQNLAYSTLELPGLPEHGDVSEWLSNGGSKEALQSLMAAMPYVVPPMPVTPSIVIEPPSQPPAPNLPDALLDPLKYSQTHGGAADAFVDRYGDRLRFDHMRGAWFVWDQHRWRQDSDEAIGRMALEHARRWAVEIVQAAEYSERKKWSDFTLRLEQLSQQQSMLRMARYHAKVKASGEEWDADPWLLCVKNGVLNLKTGELTNGKPSDNITLQASVAYDPAAICPRWLQFLDEVFGTDDDGQAVISFVQQFAGYCLTGRTSEQIVVMCHGKGRNGKGRLLHAIHGVLGDYAGVLPFASLAYRKSGEASNDMAGLQGKRFITASEVNEGTRLNEARIKSLTGEDPMTARFLYKEYVTFDPAAKFILAVNHRPTVKDDSEGFWRRVRLIPFLKQFNGAAQDKDLDGKLEAEWPGILAWAMIGCMAWQMAGKLPEPAIITAATKEYELDSDPLEDFLTTCCLRVEPETGEKVAAMTSATDLFKAYLWWCDDTKRSKEDRLGSTTFGLGMASKVEKKRFTGGIFYRGIKLTESAESEIAKHGGKMF